MTKNQDNDTCSIDKKEDVLTTESDSADCEKKALESGDENDNKNEQENEAVQPTAVPFYMTVLNRILNFYFSNSLLCLVAIAILLAYAYPPLGAEYLQPKITASWIAVIFIFGKSFLWSILRKIVILLCRII